MRNGYEKNVFFKNVMYTFSSNFTSLIVNALIVLLLPKIIGVKEYGYYQLYVLMASYTLYCHFGWCDGIYLRNVGKSKEQMNKEMMSSQFWMICVFSVTVCLICIFVGSLTIRNGIKKYIWYIVSIDILLSTIRIYMTVIFQAFGDMKQYSQVILSEKILNFILLLVMIGVKVTKYEMLIWADVIGKIAAIIVGGIYCKEIISTRIYLFRTKKYLLESLANIKVGIFLLISNLAGILITGIIQFSVERQWNIETFSKVSLTFNMSKMLMVVINAVSIVMVPTIKNISESEMKLVYVKMQKILAILFGAMMIIYYPLKEILRIWLPQYQESIAYMALLFPMCLFESKTNLLLNAYLKALRKEKILCLGNTLMVGVSAILSYVVVFKFSNLTLAIVLIPILLAMRSFFLEKFIQSYLQVNLWKNAVLEICIAGCFMALAWYVEARLSIMIYLIIYFVCYKSDLFCIAQKVRKRNEVT